jgi:hypothetical protein
VNPRAGLDDVEKRKFLTLPDDPSVVHPVASRYTDCAVPLMYLRKRGKGRKVDISHKAVPTQPPDIS